VLVQRVQAVQGAVLGGQAREVQTGVVDFADGDLATPFNSLTRSPRSSKIGISGTFEPSRCSTVRGGSTSSRTRSPQSAAGITIDDEIIFSSSSGFTAAQRAASATGAPNTDTLYRSCVPAYPTMTRPDAMPMCGQ
jgi:hypothetical protein